MARTGTLLFRMTSYLVLMDISQCYSGDQQVLRYGTGNIYYWQHPGSPDGSSGAPFETVTQVTIKSVT